MTFLYNILESIVNICTEHKFTLPSKVNIMLNTNLRYLIKDSVLEGKDLLDRVVVTIEEIEFIIDVFKEHLEDYIVAKTQDMTYYFNSEDILYEEED